MEISTLRCQKVDRSSASTVPRLQLPMALAVLRFSADSCCFSRRENHRRPRLDRTRLWSIDGTSPFVITNADTTCQAFTPGMTPSCIAVNQLAAVGAANTTGSDQYYPQLNGNNLYFGLSATVVVPPFTPAAVFWVADAQGAQIIDPAFISPGDVAAYLPASFPPPIHIRWARWENQPLIIPIPRTWWFTPVMIQATTESPLFLGRVRTRTWVRPLVADLQGTPPIVPAPFSTNVLAVNNCPTPAATAIPGAPTVARAKATGTNVAVSWSAAQSVQPVTSYHVRTFANAVFLSDTPVAAPVGGFRQPRRPSV